MKRTSHVRIDVRRARDGKWEISHDGLAIHRWIGEDFVLFNKGPQGLQILRVKYVGECFNTIKDMLP